MAVGVIAGDIGNAGGVEGNAGYARLLQRVAGNLHHGVAATVVDHACQQGGQPLGPRRGVRGVFQPRAVEVSQGPARPCDNRPRSALRQSGNWWLSCRLCPPRRSHSGVDSGCPPGPGNSAMGFSCVSKRCIGHGDIHASPLGSRPCLNGRSLSTAAQPRSNSFADERVTVALLADPCDKQIAGTDLPRVHVQPRMRTSAVPINSTSGSKLRRLTPCSNRNKLAWPKASMPTVWLSVFQSG